jgi:hypothetical protein
VLSWRWITGLSVLALILLIVAAGGLTLALSRHSASAAGAARRPDIGGRQSLAAEAAARAKAVTWVSQQVSRGDMVGCDAVLCSALAAHRFPAGNLLVLGATAIDPFGSAVVIASGDIRSQFGSKLGTDYAPLVLASFGTGNARIDIRQVASQGLAVFRAALSADLLARRASGAEMLGNKKITVSAGASRQLTAGQVDTRLLIAITTLAGQNPVHVVGFGNSAPGASAAAPLRFADLAETDRAAHIGKSAYLRSMLSLLAAQDPLYRPASAAPVRLASGQAVLRIEFTAPSPPGLLKTGSP